MFLGIWAGICLVFALTPLLKGAQVRLWLLVLFGLCVACLFYPAPLRPLYRVWLIFGEIMGFCISRTILFVLFFGIFTPIGLVFRVMRRDCLAQHFELDAQSYFIDRKEEQCTQCGNNSNQCIVFLAKFGDCYSFASITYAKNTQILNLCIFVIDGLRF